LIEILITPMDATRLYFFFQKLSKVLKASQTRIWVEKVITFVMLTSSHYETNGHNYWYP